MKPTYESPLASRYASKTMLHLFSPDMRYETWRRLWVALARAEHNLGLPRHAGAGGRVGRACKPPSITMWSQRGKKRFGMM